MQKKVLIDYFKQNSIEQFFLLDENRKEIDRVDRLTGVVNYCYSPYIIDSQDNKRIVSTCILFVDKDTCYYYNHVNLQDRDRPRFINIGDKISIQMINSIYTVPLLNIKGSRYKVTIDKDTPLYYCFESNTFSKHKPTSIFISTHSNFYD